MTTTAREARAFVLFLFLAVLHTWPLASAPHRLSLNHNADAQLNAWIVSWVAHALPTTPLQLWTGNIFQPGERALSFSEPLVVPGIAGAPVFWLTGSLGTATPVYKLVYHLVPPIQGIRAAARFGMLALAGIALLAAVAIAWLERRMRPVTTTEFTGVPAVYSLLQDESGPVLLAEMPFYPPDAVFQNGEYVLNATAHWRPVMNGYSGATPMSFRRYSEMLWYFPEARAFPALRDAGATHVMVHLEKFGSEAPDVARALEGHPNLRLMAADRDGHRLYRMVRE